MTQEEFRQMVSNLDKYAYQLKAEVSRYASRGNWELDEMLAKLTAAKAARDKADANRAEYDALYPKKEVPPPIDQTLDGWKHPATNRGIGH